MRQLDERWMRLMIDAMDVKTSKIFRVDISFTSRGRLIFIISL